MWLSGGTKPDFRTINYFRGNRLKSIFYDLFRQVVKLLHKEGFVSLQIQYIDGTKIESTVNKYSFVWRGSVEKHDKQLREKTDAILRETEQVIHNEQQERISCKNSQSELEYQAHTKLYQATDAPYPLRKECHNAEENRSIRVNQAYGQGIAYLPAGDVPSIVRKDPLSPNPCSGILKAIGSFEDRFTVTDKSKYRIRARSLGT